MVLGLSLHRPRPALQAPQLPTPADSNPTGSTQAIKQSHHDIVHPRNPREENVTSTPRLTRAAFKRHGDAGRGDAGRGAAGVRSSKLRRPSPSRMQKRMLRIMESLVALSGSHLGVQRRMSVAAQKCSGRAPGRAHTKAKS